MGILKWAVKWTKDNPDKAIIGVLALGFWSRAKFLYEATSKPTLAVLVVSLAACLAIALAEIWRGTRQHRFLSARLTRLNSSLQAKNREISNLRSSPARHVGPRIEKFRGPDITHAGMLWEQFSDYDTVEKTYELSTHGPLCTKCKTQLGQHAELVMLCPKEDCSTRYKLPKNITWIKSDVEKIADSNWRNGPKWEPLE